MPKYVLELRICDEHGDEILAASAPCKRCESAKTLEHEFADAKNLVHMLRTMKTQRGHRGTAWWEFKIGPESAKAKLLSKMLRTLS
jgi:hypothetical protein